jgi:hypothetical protein
MAAVVASAAAASNHLTPVDKRGSGIISRPFSFLPPIPKMRRKLMSHNVAPPLKGPAPPADEVMTVWKSVKHLGTLLTTEEVFDADGTSKRVTRVSRSMRM